jgi:hypothetical protein
MSLSPMAQSSAADSIGRAQAALWPRYECRKVVSAAVITQVVLNPAEPAFISLMVDPYGDGRTEFFFPNEQWMARVAEVGGYAVIYEDGFRAVACKAVFEAAYSAVYPKLPEPQGD